MKRRKWPYLTFLLASLIVYAVAEETKDDGPSLIVQPDSSVVPADTRISFFCRADGNPLPNVVWRKNEHVITDTRYTTKTLSNGLSTLRIDPVLLEDSNTTISCTADNGVGTPIKAEATLTVLPADQLPEGFPLIEAHPALKSVEQGRTAHVTCRVEGDPRPKVLWLRDLMPIDIRSNPRYSVSTLGNPGALMIQQAREEDQGKYECIARNSQGVVHSKSAHLYVKVRRVPPYFTYKLERVYRVGIGGSVNLTCVAVGYPMPRVFWKRQSDDFFLNDPQTAPIGKNVLTLTNLEQTENYTCIAVSKLGNIETSTTVEVKELLPAPTNLKILEVTATTVSLRWNPVTNIPDDDSLRGYIIKYRQKYAERGAYKEVKVPGDANSALIENLEPYQQYEFSAQVVSTIGRGALSPPVEAQTSEAAPGAPPSNVQARSLNRNSILIRWDPPTDKQNGRINGYKIHYTNRPMSTDVTEWEVKEVKQDELMTTLYELDPDKTYYVQVQAKNAKGYGPMSKVVTVITKPGIPGQPSNLVAKALDSHRIQLNWQKPMHSYNINGYVIQYSASEDGVKELTLASDVQKHIVDGLRPNTIYTFKVAAQSDRGQGTFCDEVQAKTHESADSHRMPVPSAPRDLELIAVNASAVKLTWEKPEQANGELLGYYVYKEKLLNGEPVLDKLRKEIVIADPNKLHTLITNLEPNTEYAFRVNAFNMYGDGEHSSSRKIMTGGIPPSEPRPQSVSLLNEDPPLRARIEWLPPEITYDQPINKYVVWYRPVDKIEFERAEVPGTQHFVELNNLAMGREYEIRLAAANDEGLSINSTERLITPVGVPEGEPLNVRYDIVGGQLNVQWDPPEMEKRNGNITYYRAVLTPLDGEGKKIDRNVSDRSITYRVNAKNRYSFKVTAATMKGEGPSSDPLNINPYLEALVGPPTNVRVQATSNSSAVIQWDFDETQTAGSADGFVVKYIHEPVLNGRSGGVDNTDHWRAQTVMDPAARHLEITRLTVHKPYAFCVLAIKQSRLGPCSEPPVTIDRLQPTHMVQNLHVQYKTSQSVALQWEYEGPQPIGFYIKQSGKKTYLNQFLEEKSLVAPGFEKRVEGVERSFMWQNLRPYMDYTFQVGVYSPKDGNIFWPRELMVRTDPTGPPFVDTPELVESKHPGTALFKLRCASEEYGAVSHYWVIVVPGNYTKDDVLNMDSQMLEKATMDLRPRLATMNPSITAKKVRKSTKTKEPPKIIPPRPVLEEEDDSEEQESKPIVSKSKTNAQKSRRYLRDTRKMDGVYIAANIPSHQMQHMTREERLFTLGDGKEYEGFLNHPLDPTSKYSLMMRAFAKSDNSRRSDRPFEFRPPMQEPAAKLFTDSMLSEPFGTKGAGIQRTARGSNFWLVGPAIALLVICVIIGMLVIWWLRCSRKGARTTHRNGSIAKVALSSTYTNGGPNETSKLLLGTDQYGRPVMNAYEMNGNMESTMTYPEPTYATHTNGHITSNGHANGHVASTGGNYPTVQLPLMTSSAVGGTMFAHGPIALPEFASHIDKLKMNNNSLFTQEFESIETGQRFTWEASSLEYNKPKNRYANVVAYDHSRVILSTVDGVPGSDYINANYIDGYDRPKAYIAAQGPLPETFADFWRMVWEERSVTIVMLTKLEERSRIKCDLYWPTRGTSIYGKVAVSLMDTLELAHYTIRTMRLENLEENEVREIRHLQYTAWPDHGVPDHPTPFLMFLKRVKALNPPDAGPIISHCSAGIGRTGAFIVIDMMLDRLRYENTVDIYGCVTALRAQRSYMVQTDDQYIFIHDAVLDAAQSGSTEVPASKLYHHLQVLMQIQHHDQVSGLEIEFRTLATLKTMNSRCQVANLPVNRPKNRHANMVPFDTSRVILQAIPGLEGSDYINASWVDGYRQRNAYIATQAPLLSTTDDFWRMLWENGSCIVVMLTKLREQGREKCCEYYPVECGAQFGNLVVEPIAEYNMPQYVLREFKMADPQTGQTRTLRHFQYTEWPEQGVPPSAEMFIDFIHQVHRTKSQFGVDGPICVHCSSGTGRTGVFIGLSIIIDRMKLEHVVDVFTTVKLLRTERQNMVQEKDEYEFCYRAALEFLATYDNPYSLQ